MIIPGLAPRVGSGALVPGSLRRAWLLGTPLGGVVRTPSASQSSLTPDTASVVTANGSSTIAYTGVLRDESGNEMVGQTGVTVEAVEWFPLSTILAGSFVSVSSPFIASDGVEEVTITVQLGGYRNGEWYPLVGVAAADIGVAVSGTNNVIDALAGVTDADGIIETTFTTTQASTVKTVSATLFGDAVTDTATCESDGEAEPPPPEGDPFFEDDFAGPGFNEANGFDWKGLNNTEVVDVGGGDTAIEFTYPGEPSGSDHNSEQRADFGRDLSELWMQFDWEVPANFAHRNDSPNNNKFLQFWDAIYAGTDGHWRCGFEFRRGSSDTESTLRPMSTSETNNSNTSTGLGHPAHNAVFISPSGPCIPGERHIIRVHLKAASAGGVADGVMGISVDGVLVGGSELTTGAFRNFDDDPTTVKMRNFYLMGWANSGYADETVFRVRDFAIYDTDPEWAEFA